MKIPVIEKSKSQTKKYFSKRSYSLSKMIRDFATLTRKMPSVMDTMKSKRISEKFVEKIMLAVTSVNDCRYCSYFHTQNALNSGFTSDEIKEIMSSDFSSCNDSEPVALAFAQHYAESCGKPDETAVKRLISYYGIKKSRDIVTYIQMITIGNLGGNTLDAFESRLKGVPPEDGSIIFEAFAYLFSYPIIKIMNQKM